MLTGTFRTIVADPPWAYRDGLQMQSVRRSARAHYSTMSVDDICALGAPGGEADFNKPADAFLWLWVTNPILLDGSGAAVCRAWGYEPRQLVTWVKGSLVGDLVKRRGQYRPLAELVLQIGMGHYTRGATEHLILATRGRTKHLLKSRGVPNVFVAPRGRHSEKPQAAYDLVRSLTPGRYLELFARTQRKGWSVWGNEVRA